MRVFLFFFFFLFQLSAQETSNSRKATKAFLEAKTLTSNQEYNKAYSILIEALTKDHKFIEAWILLGDVCVAMGDRNQGIEAYKKTIPLSPGFSYPMYYRLAHAERSIGEYSDALKHIKKYMSSNSISDKYKEKASTLRQSCEFSILAMKNPVAFNPINLGKNINSDADEYLPALTMDGSTLIFTRSKIEQGYRNEDFYLSYHNTDFWEPSRNLGGPINTEQNEGAQCITADGKTIYFTACSRTDAYGSCDIYESHFVNEKWTKPFNVGPKVNSESWESQPAISSDGRQLFFVSNRSGGFGKKDIWVSYKTTDGSWSQAKNLGKEINSSKDDISPFLHWDNQTLYFSSKGYIGLGGFDIYLSRLDLHGNWGTVKNIGYPINSPSDENSLIVAKDGRTAYFASSFFNEGRTDLDLYTFDLPYESRAIEVSYIQGNIKDANTKKSLRAHIDLIDLDSRIGFKPYQSDQNGDYMLCLPSDVSYALTVSKKNYMFYSENILLDHQGSTVIKDFQLQPLKVGEQVRLDNIFFEKGAYVLKDASSSELNQIIYFMESNPFLILEIGGHTDNIGTIEYNINLSDKRALAVKNALTQRGMVSERILTKGYGMSVPQNDNTSREKRSINRRTELTIISLE